MKILKLIILGVIIVIILLLLPVITEIIVNFLIVIKVVDCSLKSTYVSFFSSILGGSVTLIGVWLTLVNEKRDREKDDSIKYKPILRLFGINRYDNCILTSINYSMPFYCSSNSKLEDESNHFFQQIENKSENFRLLFKNVGRGETVNAFIEDSYITSVDFDEQTNLFCSGGLNQYIGMICKDELIGVDFYLPCFLFVSDNKKDDLNMKIRMDLVIGYSDMFGRERYKLIVNIELLVIVYEVSEELPYSYKEGFKWARVGYSVGDVSTH